MAKKKKISGLSVSIVALNIVIVGIIILLIVLIYLHIKDDKGNQRGEITTTTEITAGESNITDITQGSDTQSEAHVTDIATEAETQAVDPAVDPVVSNNYDPAFFQNDLFIGDSISTGLYLYSFLDKNNVFAEVGLNPESASKKEIDGVTCIEKAQTMNPKHIYIMLGSNGLAFL